jgi:pimeloyl-ACP methyl ester carboxylesterase
VTLLPDLGHIPQLEDPDAVAGTIERLTAEASEASGAT